MSAELRDLTDTVVVVTGAGSGIGAETVGQLLEAGARVVSGDISAAGLDSLRAKHGDECLRTVVADVADSDACEKLLHTGVAAWGRVDSVISNAGIGFFGGVLDAEETQVRAMAQVNFLGTVWLSRAALRHFRERSGGGDVIVLGSVAGLGSGGGGEAIYAATKAAQMQFATSLDREVRHEGIRVSVVAPAGVNTSFAAATGRFGDLNPADADFLHTADVAHALVSTLRQPRRIRTALWSLWSVSEPNG
ncbi:short-chain dehydrogenase/reductase SDR [Microbacterium esteraromaticum]|uniref:Short-chain dehydrogenase/reductase SDR n=1 Tax=Microbacterium esteraromaticum TaxID=57043 RepID=A0A1R4K6E0_9MICO|nr:SDR family NAD(P)-dependent oxidoreductase [Microbacterium esteraromaticum]SJN40001.1 short-chain dehydrogenase/reductase SDR [Microbacterium esteraromaticum]